MSKIQEEHIDLPEESMGHSSSTEGLSSLRFTKHEDAVLTRKLDRHILPICRSVFTLYVLAFLDRSNIGNAYTAGMGKELGISSSQYQWLLTIYYISYIVFQPMVLAWKVIPPRTIASAMTFLWGITSILQAAATSWSGLMVARFFLGAFEASFAPGVTLYLSYFYPRHQYGLRMGIYVAGAALASSFAGALAYGIVHIRGAGIANWKLLFIVEGAPTILFAPIVYFFLPSSIDECRFLTDREKELARLRMRTSNTSHLAETDVDYESPRKDSYKLSGGIDWKQVALSFKDPTNYATAVLFFIANVTFASLPVYLPTILSEAGFGAVRAQGLSAPPYLAAFVSALTFMSISDRLRHRGLFVASLAVVGGVGYLILALKSDSWVRYGATFLVAVGCFTLVPSWIANNQIKDSQRGAGFALFGVIGQCGPILGVRLYPSKQGPKYVKGMSIGAGLLFFAAFLAASLSAYFVLSNRRLDRIHGRSQLYDPQRSTSHQTDDAETGRMEDDDDNVKVPQRTALASQSKGFRYIA